MKQLIRIAFAYAIIMAAGVACSSSAAPTASPIPPTLSAAAAQATQVIVGHAWVLQSLMVNGQVQSGAEAYTFEFQADGSFKEKRSNAQAVDQGRWGLDGNGTRLTIASDNGEAVVNIILELNTTRFRFQPVGSAQEYILIPK